MLQDNRDTARQSVARLGSRPFLAQSDESFSFGRVLAQIAVMALVLGLAFAVTLYLVKTKPQSQKRPVFPTVYTVKTTVAEMADHQPFIGLYGEVLAGRSVDLRSLVSGEIKVVSKALKSGGRVNEGDLLLEVDDFNFQGALREARSNLSETLGKIDEANARIRLENSRLDFSQDQLELAESDLARINELKTKGTATTKQVEDRTLVLSQRGQALQQSEINLVAEQARIRQLQAARDRLMWKVEQAERNLVNTKLVAPFSATIRSSSAEVGKLVNANDVLVSLYQPDNLEARFVLSDGQFGRIQSSGENLIDRPITAVWKLGGRNHAFPGKIERIGAEIIADRGGIELFAKLQSPDPELPIRPGAFVEVSLPDRVYENHFRLPESAIYQGSELYVVEDGVLVRREVNVITRDGPMVILTGNIQSGEEVLLTRISEISEGLNVRREQDAQKEQAGSSDNGT